MKKILAFLGLVVIMSACQMSTTANVNKIGDNLRYFKDSRTGLCFAAIGSVSASSGSSYTSITCVPCEALKNVEVKELK